MTAEAKKVRREPATPVHEAQLRDMLIRDNKRMRQAGCKLAEAAIYTVREYDGLHRLSLAVAEWAKAVADEGDRPRAPKHRQHCGKGESYGERA